MPQSCQNTNEKQEKDGTQFKEFLNAQITKTKASSNIGNIRIFDSYLNHCQSYSNRIIQTGSSGLSVNRNVSKNSIVFNIIAFHFCN